MLKEERIQYQDYFFFWSALFLLKCWYYPINGIDSFY